MFDLIALAFRIEMIVYTLIHEKFSLLGNTRARDCTNVNPEFVILMMTIRKQKADL